MEISNMRSKADRKPAYLLQNYNTAKNW